MPARFAFAVLACDAVCDERQEALGGAGEGELLPPGARRVRADVPARDGRPSQLHALRLQKERGSQEL